MLVSCSFIYSVLYFLFFFFFFFNDTATTEIYTLSLHDALPIWVVTVIAALHGSADDDMASTRHLAHTGRWHWGLLGVRSEEHTSELQSLAYLVCRLLLEKKKYLTKTRCDVKNEQINTFSEQITD